MINPDELERAVERLTDLLPRLDACSGYAAHSGTPAARQTGAPRDLYWNDHLAADLRLILSANREMRTATPDLTAVIAWLKNGCDPAHAVTELQIYQDRIARSALTTQ